MSAALIAKMRRAREVEAEALGFRFTLRVPNGGEIEDLNESLSGKRLTFRRLLIASVVGWSLHEIDLIPGGSPVPVEFERELFIEWLNEHDQAIEPLFTVLADAMAARKARREEDAKN